MTQKVVKESSGSSSKDKLSIDTNCDLPPPPRSRRSVRLKWQAHQILDSVQLHEYNLLLLRSPKDNKNKYIFLNCFYGKASWISADFTGIC